MVTYRSVIQRYCPSKEHNVQIEISRHDDGRITEKCLHPECRTQRCRTCGRDIYAGKPGCETTNDRHIERQTSDC